MEAMRAQKDTMVIITGMFSIASEASFWICDSMNQKLKKYKLDEQNQMPENLDNEKCVIYESEDSMVYEGCLVQGKYSLLLATMEQKRAAGTIYLAISKLENDGKYHHKNGTDIEARMDYDMGTVFQACCGHIFCSMRGFKKLYEYEINEQVNDIEVTNIRTHALPEKFVCMTRAKKGNNEILYISLTDGTIREYILGTRTMDEIHCIKFKGVSGFSTPHSL